MMQCLLMGSDEVFLRYYNLFRMYEETGKIRIAGVSFTHMRATTEFYSEILGYRNILPEELNYDPEWYVLVMADGELSRQLTGMLAEAGIPEEKIIPYRVLLIWDLDIERYLQLRADPPTVFANNCIGGILFNRLGLRFQSPFINLWLDQSDYLRFLESPQDHMQQELVYLRDEYEEILKRDYPVCGLGDVELHFNHYVDFDEAKAAWDRRKERIRWDRLLVLMHTEKPEQAAAFSDLPYEKKLCFVPFETDDPSLCYLDINRPEHHFWDLVNSIAGDNPYLDIVELLECRVRKLSVNRG